MTLRRGGVALLAGMLAAAAPAPQTIRIASEAVPLDPAAPSRTKVDALEYVWGARLTAKGTSRLGGLSGLEAEPQGSKLAFTAVTDDGDLVRWTASGDAPPAARATIRPLLDPKRAVPPRKELRDAEDLAWNGDELLVSFEGRHRIWRYPTIGGAAEPHPAPVVSVRHENLGFEALAVLPGPKGPTLAVGTEDGRLWLCPPPAERCDLVLRAPPEFGWWLTSLDHLPGSGDLVALYRFYNPFNKRFSTMIAYLPVRDGRVAIRPLARLAAPMQAENFEGIAAVREGDGYRLFIISDDGFSAARRTLLLAFDWKPQ